MSRFTADQMRRDEAEPIESGRWKGCTGTVDPADAEAIGALFARSREDDCELEAVLATDRADPAQLARPTHVPSVGL